MINPKPLGKFASRYYVEHKEDPEPDSLWIGIGAAKLGVAGKSVNREQFRNALKGRSPATRVFLLLKRKLEHKPGWDFIFAPQKDFSILWGLQRDAWLRAAVRYAHSTAVAGTLALFEKYGGATRVTHDGVMTLVPAGLVAGTFEHFVNRDNEPHLHTHATVMNLALKADGTFGAVADRELYRLRTVAETVYDAIFRHELAKLGYRFERDESGNLVVSGIPQILIEAFSTRGEGIRAYLKKLGRTDAAARARAFYATRRNKEAHTLEELQASWFELCEILGIDPEEILAIARALGDGNAPYDASDPEWVDYALTQALSEFGVTEKKATFSRLDVLRYFAILATDGATLEQLELLTDAFFARAEVLAIDSLDSPETPKPGGWELGSEGNNARRRFTLKSVLSMEDSILEAAGRKGVDTRSCQVGVAEVELALSQASASDMPPSPDQSAMVRSLTTSGELVELVRGVPGSGKTLSLAIAARLWGKAGYPVLGTAPTGSAADKLRDGAKIQSRTIASLLLDIGQKGLARRSVVVVDEAGMADTRSLAQLVQLVRAADGKLVLVGDDRQLPSVGAGGMFATLWRKKGGVELTENMRQVHPWMRDALEDLRAHRTKEALARFDKNGLVHTSSEESELRQACVSGWFADRLHGHDTAILTHQNEDVEALNDMAHSMLEAEGEIGKPLVYLARAREHPGVPGRSYNKGETIVFLRNESMARIGKNERVDVRNSNVGVVLGFDQANQLGAVELDNGARVWVKLAYLQEHTAYGYARTVHKIQGATVGRQDPERSQLGTAHIYRPESLGFEAAHVALSRATHSATLYVLEDALPGEAVPGGASRIDARRAALERVLRAWGQQRAERSATDWREIIKENAKRRGMGAVPGEESAGLVAPRASQAHKAEHAPARRDTAGLAASFQPQSPDANGSGPELGSEPPSGKPGGNPGPASRPGAQSEGPAAPRGPKRPRLNVVERFMSIAEGDGAPGPVPTAGRAATTPETTGADTKEGKPANTPTNGFPKGVTAMAGPAEIEYCTAPELEF